MVGNRLESIRQWFTDGAWPGLMWKSSFIFVNSKGVLRFGILDKVKDLTTTMFSVKQRIIREVAVFLLLRSWEVKGRRGKNDWFLSRRCFVSEFTRETPMNCSCWLTNRPFSRSAVTYRLFVHRCYYVTSGNAPGAIFFRALPFVLKQPIRIVLHAWPAWEQKIMKRLSASSRSRSLCVRNFLI